VKETRWSPAYSQENVHNEKRSLVKRGAIRTTSNLNTFAGLILGKGASEKCRLRHDAFGRDKADYGDDGYVVYARISPDR
jgi:hypothetical protein